MHYQLFLSAFSTRKSDARNRGFRTRYITFQQLFVCMARPSLATSLRALHGRGMRQSFICANSHARASRGANVVVNYAGSKDAAEAVAKEIEGMGVKAMAVKVCLLTH